jgi:cytochrome c oxidase subunit 3
MSLRTLDRGYEPPQEEGAYQALSHQFEDLEQQNESYIVGMWTFLVTEIMFFGALFLAYSVYRVEYWQAYLDAHRFLSIGWGTVNTFVLLTSSLAMALGVFAAQMGRRKTLMNYLIFVILCSCVFLGVKSIEYSAKIRLGLFPGPNFDFSRAKRVWLAENPGKTDHDGESMGSEWTTALNGPSEEALRNPHVQSYQPVFRPAAPSVAGESIGYNTNVTDVTGTGLAVATLPAKALDAEQRSRNAQLFFCLYFVMTGLHALHIIIGILLMSVIWFLCYMKHPSVEDYMPTEMIGFYWHFVDIVWIFLFPMMYLLS